MIEAVNKESWKVGLKRKKSTKIMYNSHAQIEQIAISEKTLEIISQCVDLEFRPGCTNKTHTRTGDKKALTTELVSCLTTR